MPKPRYVVREGFDVLRDRVYFIVDTKPKSGPVHYGHFTVGTMARRVARLLNEDQERAARQGKRTKVPRG